MWNKKAPFFLTNVKTEGAYKHNYTVGSLFYYEFRIITSTANPSAGSCSFPFIDIPPKTGFAAANSAGISISDGSCQRFTATKTALFPLRRIYTISPKFA